MSPRKKQKYGTNMLILAGIRLSPKEVNHSTKNSNLSHIPPANLPINP